MTAAEMLSHSPYQLAPPISSYPTLNQQEQIYDLNESEVDPIEAGMRSSYVPEESTPRLAWYESPPLTPEQAALESPPSPSGSMFAVWPISRSHSVGDQSHPHSHSRSLSLSHSRSNSPHRPRLNSASSSNRSIHTSSFRNMTPPTSPTPTHMPEVRSRVSLDAVPTPITQPIETFPSTAHSPSRSSISARVRWDDQHQSSLSTPTGSLPDLRASSSASTSGLMLRSKPSLTSQNGRPLTSHSVHWEVDEDQDQDHNEDEDENEANGNGVGQAHRRTMDHNIRSAPGVIGLGEGWAGGPQSRSRTSRKGSGSARRRWFSRREILDEDDPLALWYSGNGKEDKSASRPMRDLWNRSKQSLWGGSTPALHAEQERPGISTSTSNRRLSLRSFFSKSHSTLNLSHSPTFGIASTSPKKQNHTWPKSSAITPEPRTSPIISSSRPFIPPSPSLPVLSTITAESTPSRGRMYSEDISVTPLNNTADRAGSVTFPQRSASLSPAGLRPPWRQSMVGTKKPQPSVVPNMVDPLAVSTDMTTSLVTPTPTSALALTEMQNEEMSEQTNLKPLLRRTSTFGNGHAPLSSEPEPVPGLDTIEAWALNAAEPSDTIPPKDFSESSHKRKLSLHQRGASLFGKMKNVVSSAFARSDPSTSGPAPSRPKTPTMERFTFPRRTSSSKTPSSAPASDFDPSTQSGFVGSVRLKPEDSSASAPPHTETMGSIKRRRRRSWSALQGSTFAKRLSKLTEIDQEQEQESGFVVHGDGEFGSLQAKAEAGGDEPVNRSRSFVDRLKGHRNSSSLSLTTPLGYGHGNSRIPDGQSVPIRGGLSRQLSGYSGLSASISMPTLTSVKKEDLNIHVDVQLEGSDLGLEDILNTERRESIVHQLELFPQPPAPHPAPPLGVGITKTNAREREEAIQATSNALEGTSISIPMSMTNSNSARHMKNESSSSESSSSQGGGQLVTPNLSIGNGNGQGIFFSPNYNFPSRGPSPSQLTSHKSPTDRLLVPTPVGSKQQRESLATTIGQRSSLTSLASNDADDIYTSMAQPQRAVIVSVADRQRKASIVSMGLGF